MPTVTDASVSSAAGRGVEEATVVIAGVASEEHVGRHLRQAASALGVSATLCDTSQAYTAPAIVRHVNWRLRGRRPSRLRAFSRDLVAACERQHPSYLVATGLAPIDAVSLAEIGTLGVRRVNYLTDDPWSANHRAPWFMPGLAEYDEVFTPRMANVADLKAAGCRRVTYLPFAYAPDVHFADPPATADEHDRFDSDVVFVGGADPDRVRWVEPLIAAGFRVALYGGYWDRFPATRASARGMADAWTVRKAIGGAAAALCLVRQANRDGNCMRTFEVPAVGACMLLEDTAEHRTLFGDDGRAVRYIRNPEDACERLAALLGDEQERRRLKDAAQTVVQHGRHTWQDRLASMLSVRTW